MTPEQWAEVERLYHAALARRPDERAAFIADGCPDPALRAEVSSLLDHRLQGDELLRDDADHSMGTLTAGTRLGPYEIEAFLEAGGAGDVYRATDTRLGRTVAVKVVREPLNMRFESEARAVASLNHPRVCTLYDVGPRYLVMELVEGESLASVLKKGPLSPSLAVRYASQIADGLAAAHSQGIVHRDLKPSNVMVTRGGVKVLDFGIATFAGTAAPKESGKTDTPGTLAYMAPEQLAGGPCDARSDIYALGLVLHEMLTGRVRHVATAPSGHGVPPALRVLLAACLEDDPGERWHSAHDLKRSLEWVGRELEHPTLPTPKVGWWPWAACVAAVAVAAVGWMWPRPVPPPAAAAHFVLDPPPATRIAMRMPTKALASVSPDGTRLVLVAEDAGGTRSLWLRVLDSDTYQHLKQTEGASLPFWSPDSQFIGFFAQGKLKRVPAQGGAAQTICDIPAGDGEGASWSRDGSIVFAPPRPQAAALPTGALSRVSVASGVVDRFTTLDSADGEVSHSWPQFLPDGRHVLYLSRNKDPKKSRTYVQALGADTRQVVLTGQTAVLYAHGPVGDAYLLYPRDRALMAQQFDLPSFRVTGEPLAVASGVSYNTLYGTTAFTVSDTGVLVFRSGIFSAGTSPIRQIAWYTRRGDRVSTLGEPGYFSQFALSPDGTRIAVDRNAQPDDTRFWDVWTLDLASGIFSRLTQGPRFRLPVWAPDSRRIAAVVGRGNDEQIVEVPLDTGQPRVLIGHHAPAILESWSPDGRFLFFSTGSAAQRLPVANPTRVASLLTWDLYRGRSAVSPNGRWIAYQSTESGRNEVYVRAYPTLDRKQQVSNGGGAQPTWSRDGTELFYLTLNAKLMAVDVDPGASLTLGEPHALFQTPIEGNLQLGQYAVAADGQRFLMMENTREGATSAIEQYHVQVNWFAALRSGRP